MNREFTHSFWTGSGQIEVSLSLGPNETASISVQCRWMGGVERKYTLQCHHHAVTEYHGFLRIDSVDGNLELPTWAFRSSEGWSPIFFEYFRLANPAALLQDDPALPAMEGLGYAGSMRQFDLILQLTRFCSSFDQPEIPESQKMRALIDDLEKVKFLSSDTPKPSKGKKSKK